MELNEAIAHARRVAEGCGADNPGCAYQHDKLAEWLEELKRYKELGTIERLRELAQADLEEWNGMDVPDIYAGNKTDKGKPHFD